MTETHRIVVKPLFGLVLMFAGSSLWAQQAVVVVAGNPDCQVVTQEIIIVIPGHPDGGVTATQLTLICPTFTEAAGDPSPDISPPVPNTCKGTLHLTGFAMNAEESGNASIVNPDGGRWTNYFTWSFRIIAYDNDYRVNLRWTEAPSVFASEVFTQAHSPVQFVQKQTGESDEFATFDYTLDGSVVCPNGRSQRMAGHGANFLMMPSNPLLTHSSLVAQRDLARRPIKEKRDNVTTAAWSVSESATWTWNLSVGSSVGFDVLAAEVQATFGYVIGRSTTETITDSRTVPREVCGVLDLVKKRNTYDLYHKGFNWMGEPADPVFVGNLYYEFETFEFVQVVCNLQ